MRKDKRKKQKTRRKTRQRLILRKKRSLHAKHKKHRKKDCIMGMPFIIAFHGDPAQLYYCADIPKTYELIPRTVKYPWQYNSSLARLKRYMEHYVTQISGKILIFKAG